MKTGITAAIQSGPAHDLLKKGIKDNLRSAIASILAYGMTPV